MAQHRQDDWWEPALYIEDVQSGQYDLDHVCMLYILTSKVSIGTDDQQQSPQNTSNYMDIPSDNAINNTSAWDTSSLDEYSTKASTPCGEIQRHKEEHPKRTRISSNSVDTKQKRREQNRMSQMAHRQRSKKQVETLQSQLEECTEYIHTMYQTLHSIGEKTQALALEIQHVLALQPPQRSLEQSRMGSEEFTGFLWSHDGGQVLKYGQASLVDESKLPWAGVRYESDSNFQFTGFR